MWRDRKRWNAKTLDWTKNLEDENRCESSQTRIQTLNKIEFCYKNINRWNGKTLDFSCKDYNLMKLLSKCCIPMNFHQMNFVQF